MSWAGGWARFLHSRENMAPPPPLRNGGRAMHLTTPPSRECQPCLIFDIHLDEKWMWSAIHPLREVDYNSVWMRLGRSSGSDNTEEFGGGTYVFPESTMCLGDQVDNAAAFAMGHGDRPAKFLLPTTPHDDREWRFNVSIISPSCSETLIVENTIIPLLRKTWATFVANSGLGVPPVVPDYVADDKSFSPDENFLRAERISANKIGGIDNDGNLLAYECNIYFIYYWDKRNPGDERLHFVMEMNCESDMPRNMIVHPPPGQW